MQFIIVCGLFFESTTGLHATKVDLVITAYDRSPSVTAIDVTISCPLLPTYSPAAGATNVAHIFDLRAFEKNDRHLAGSMAQGRTFLPIVFTTLGGIGPPEAVHYLDALFSRLLRFRARRHRLYPPHRPRPPPLLPIFARHPH